MFDGLGAAEIVHRPAWHCGVSAMLLAWRQRLRERAELARLTERDLRDIRMTPSERLAELRKPFWQL